jgi:hypothetical protein
MAPRSGATSACHDRRWTRGGEQRPSTSGDSAAAPSPASGASGSIRRSA